jgi:formate dehydrogenase subunit delta
MNTAEKLVMMANQIARNQMHEDDPALATANHIRQFWDPRMKRLILSGNVTGLDPVAASALRLLEDAQ